ncbi:MAG: hypothetical protein WAT25_20195 [Paracoccaceae bacterium]
MEYAAIVLLAGLLLPPGYALRLAALALIGLGILAVYQRATYSVGAGQVLDETMLFWVFILLFALVAVGIGLREGLKRGRGVTGWLVSYHVQAAVDYGLIALFMAIPAGMLAVVLGDGLAGSEAPLRVHLILLAICAALALWSLWLPRLARAAELGFALALAAIVADSMRLDGQLRAHLPQKAHCLAIGPDNLAMDQLPLLMGLTAPKPILLVTGSGEAQDIHRWSFRGHEFVRSAAPPDGPPCTPQP